MIGQPVGGSCGLQIQSATPACPQLAGRAKDAVCHSGMVCSGPAFDIALIQVFCVLLAVCATAFQNAQAQIDQSEFCSHRQTGGPGADDQNIKAQDIRRGLGKTQDRHSALCKAHLHCQW